MPKLNPKGLLWFLEATLDCRVEGLLDWPGLPAKEARKILNGCTLDTACGGYCRRLVDSAATPLDRIKATLGDDSSQVEEFTRIIIYTCVIIITG